METMLELVEKEVKPRHLLATITVDLKTDSAQSAQAALATALLYLAHQHLAYGQRGSGKTALPDSGPYGVTKGSVTWSVAVQDGDMI